MAAMPPLQSLGQPVVVDGLLMLQNERYNNCLELQDDGNVALGSYQPAEIDRRAIWRLRYFQTQGESEFKAQITSVFYDMAQFALDPEDMSVSLKYNAGSFWKVEHRSISIFGQEMSLKVEANDSLIVASNSPNVYPPDQRWDIRIEQVEPNIQEIYCTIRSLANGKLLYAKSKTKLELRDGIGEIPSRFFWQPLGNNCLASLKNFRLCLQIHNPGPITKTVNVYPHVSPNTPDFPAHAKWTVKTLEDGSCVIINSVHARALLLVKSGAQGREERIISWDRYNINNPPSEARWRITSLSKSFFGSDFLGFGIPPYIENSIMSAHDNIGRTANLLFSMIRSEQILRLNALQEIKDEVVKKISDDVNDEAAEKIAKKVVTKLKEDPDFRETVIQGVYTQVKSLIGDLSVTMQDLDARLRALEDQRA